ncbi:hypothetical protein RBB75_20700 (plasmid) [Tunturibacter empetritectus]|uniref:Uncharacterized protein n=1 Tax=Tunturiibacter empetritectus TaxID=3069691 RepID=A0AAU7ZJC3_9BACT
MTKLPSNGDDYKLFVDDPSNVGIVRSVKEWKALLETPNNPLNTLSPEVIQAFSDSLVFEPGGLAHAEYGMLADTLTYRQFEEVWACFGISMAYFGDVKDFYCRAPKQCDFRTGSVCTIYCQGGKSE